MCADYGRHEPCVHPTRPIRVEGYEYRNRVTSIAKAGRAPSFSRAGPARALPTADLRLRAAQQPADISRVADPDQDRDEQRELGRLRVDDGAAQLRQEIPVA